MPLLSSPATRLFVITMASPSPPEQGGDDTRKKREYENGKGAADWSGGEEKAKKIRAEKEHSREIQNKAAAQDETKGWDLETALHQVMCTDNKEKESISSDKWITFRVGHAGDASTIASLYRKTSLSVSETNQDDKNDEKDDKNKSNEDADALELRLATGLGDEDTPPALFAVMADVISNEETPISQLGAVALLTFDWEFGKRLLRIEWFHVDETLREHDLVKRRLWFRLSALALVTACQLLLPAQST